MAQASAESGLRNRGEPDPIAIEPICNQEALTGLVEPVPVFPSRLDPPGLRQSHPFSAPNL